MIHGTLFLPQNKYFSTWCTSIVKTKTRDAEKRARESWTRKLAIKKCRAVDGEEKSLGNKEYCTQREVETEEQREIYNKKQKQRQRSIVRETKRHGGFISFSLLFTQLLWIGMNLPSLWEEAWMCLQGHAGQLCSFFYLVPSEWKMCALTSTRQAVTPSAKPINTDRTRVNRPDTDKDDQTLLLSH